MRIYWTHIRDKRTSCNLTSDKHEITSYEIHGSHVFIAFINALPDILQFKVRAGKPKQNATELAYPMAYEKLLLMAQKTSIKYIWVFPFMIKINVITKQI